MNDNKMSFNSLLAKASTEEEKNNNTISSEPIVSSSSLIDFELPKETNLEAESNNIYNPFSNDASNIFSNQIEIQEEPKSIDEEKPEVDIKPTETIPNNVFSTDTSIIFSNQVEVQEEPKPIDDIKLEEGIKPNKEIPSDLFSTDTTTLEINRNYDIISGINTGGYGEEINNNLFISEDKNQKAITEPIPLPSDFFKEEKSSKKEIENSLILPNNDSKEKKLEKEEPPKIEESKNSKTNHLIIYILMILAFIAVCVVVIKTFYFGDKIDHYEQFFTEITDKSDKLAQVYVPEEINNEMIKKVAAKELIDCINSPIDKDKLPESITSIINEINNYYNRSNNYFAFAYKDLYTGFTVSYNAKQSIFTASAIKAPTDIYIYEMASQDKIDLNEVLTYTGAYYNTGSGVLKNKSLNTNYDIKTLLEYSTVHSDNAAHNMLMDHFGRQNMLSFWQNLGTTAIFTVNNNWGILTAEDALIYMSELYRFYISDSKYSDNLMENFIRAYPKFNKGLKDYKIASKSGWAGSALHDVSIIFADNPYILVSLSNLGEGGYESYFANASSLAGRLHEAYWKYKTENCEAIKQY